MQRVYHPTLSSWYDVQDSDVDSWKESGWTTDRPDHFGDDSEEASIEVGEGYVVPTTIGQDVDEPVAPAAPPSGNASTDEWRGYAITQGASEEDIEGLSRDDLRSIYGTPAE